MHHHDSAIERYVARVSADPEVLAVVIVGSLANGGERTDSDIDLYLVVTESAWDAAFAAQRIMYVEDDDVGYEGGYYDVKLATLSYLDDAAERGDDAMRDSVANARVAFSRVPDLAERLARVAEVPDDLWDARVDSYLAQASLHGGYFLGQGVGHGDPMLTHHAAVHVALAAGRALLALNRRRYQGPKYLLGTVAELPLKPDGIVAAITEVLERPTAGAGAALVELVESFIDRPKTLDETLSTFVLDNELAWRYRTAPPEYA